MRAAGPALERNVVIVEPELRGHPKFIRLKRRIGAGALDVLVALWGHCQENQRGELWEGADAEYVADVCQWNEDPTKLFDALTEQINGRPGWIEIETGALRIHDWGKANWQLAKNWANGRFGNLGGRPKTGAKNNPKGNPNPTYGNPSGLATETPVGYQNDNVGNPIDREIDRRRERVRAHEVATGVAGPNSEQKNPGELATDAAPHIPSVEEVIAYGASLLADAIPEGYCRHYHERKQIKPKSWLYRGELIDWQREVRSFWMSDRNDWIRKNAGEKNEGQSIESLTASLERETNPERRKALRQQIKQLEVAA